MPGTPVSSSRDVDPTLQMIVAAVVFSVVLMAAGAAFGIVSRRTRRRR